jgi:hypothetical protein
MPYGHAATQWRVAGSEGDAMARIRPQSPPLVPSLAAVNRVGAGGPTHHGGDNVGGVITAQPASADAATDGGGVGATETAAHDD